LSQKAGLPKDRHQLLLWLPGTGKEGDPETVKREGTPKFKQAAANLGYHVIVLIYPNDRPATVCGYDRNPRSFEEFRMSIIAGGTSKHITVSRTDSIENRLIKLLLYLKQSRSEEHWEQFLNEDNSIKWRDIAVGGQSQGGGHAALIGVKHRVARVICSGAPKDYSHALNGPAAWYHEASATPKNRFFAFNHRQDAMGCSPENQIENLHALGLEKFGEMIDVDDERPPYRHTRILATNFPGRKIESLAAHVQFFLERFKDVWKYLLTESVQ
jgi:hypothetical protein